MMQPSSSPAAGSDSAASTSPPSTGPGSGGGGAVVAAGTTEATPFGHRNDSNDEASAATAAAAAVAPAFPAPGSNLHAFSEWFRESIARRYFFDADPLAQRVLEALLRATVLPDYDLPDERVRVIQINPAAPAEEQFQAVCGALFVVSPPPPPASAAAAAAGLSFDGGGSVGGATPHAIARNVHAVCEAVKNGVRRDRHLHIQRTLKRKLQTTLAEATRRQADAEHSGIEGLAAASFRQLRAFGARYRVVLGARPFLRGLRRLLQEQLTAPHLLCWHVHEASFTEVSDSFIEDAVRLLVNTMQLGSHFDSETAESLYHWTLPVWTSDALLRQLLGCLPPDDPRVRATGSVTVTDIPRQNPPEAAGGGLRAMCARYCAIL